MKGEGGCLVQHGDERVGVVREAAEEEAVDGFAEAGQQAGAGGSAVDGDAAGAVRVGLDRRAEGAGHRGDVRVGGGLGGADRPDRLVGDDDRSLGRALEVGRELLDVRECRGGAAQVLGLADAEHRRDAVGQGGGGLGGGDGVGLVEQAAPLGVADLGDRDADLGQFGCGDLAGVGAGLVLRDVLRADEHPGAGERGEGGGDLQVRRDDEQPHGARGHGGVRGRALRDVGEPRARPLVPEVRLQADPDGDAGRSEVRSFA
ncbi:hypothetical protein RS82_00707 [Microbacterium trichothecenolyticum]|uniref:Uncharacterized protein n=1 Tax=Microbacterium trichothecenolyticum TaxID=69370 RepID=A0A0M2HIB9_MICTR|nr:hypothetical protein RS82_00707 [Microbacterium trichothecenolyticum]